MMRARLQWIGTAGLVVAACSARVAPPTSDADDVQLEASIDESVPDVARVDAQPDVSPDVLDPHAFVEVQLAGSACARTEGGEVYCWGPTATDAVWTDSPTATCAYNASQSVPCVLRPTRMMPLPPATRVVVGGGFACALLTDHTVDCWGANAFGQLGDGLTPAEICPTFADYPCRRMPASVHGLNDAIDIAAGELMACAIHADHTVSCWGSNELGMLGIGDAPTSMCTLTSITEPCRPEPALVRGLDHVMSIDIGMESVCAVRDDGTVWCWGAARAGELGTAGPDLCPNPEMRSQSVPCARTPVQVPGLSDVVQVAVGGSLEGGNACALTRSGAVFCWGLDEAISLDLPEASVGTCDLGGTIPGPCALMPTLLPGLAGARSIAMDQYDGLAVMADGTLRRWGSWRPSTFDVAVPGLPPVLQLSPGLFKACVLTVDHAVYCWGDNYDGSIGDGTTTSRSTPVRVLP